MTPLTIFLSKYMPEPLVKLVTTLIYTLTLITIFVLIGRPDVPMIYLDVG